MTKNVGGKSRQLLWLSYGKVAGYTDTKALSRALCRSVWSGVIGGGIANEHKGERARYDQADKHASHYDAAPGAQQDIYVLTCNYCVDVFGGDICPVHRAVQL